MTNASKTSNLLRSYDFLLILPKLCRAPRTLRFTTGYYADLRNLTISYTLVKRLNKSTKYNAEYKSGQHSGLEDSCST